MKGQTPTPVTYYRGPLDGYTELLVEQPKLMLVPMLTPMALTKDELLPLTAIYRRVAHGRYEYMVTAFDDTTAEDYDWEKKT